MNLHQILTAINSFVGQAIANATCPTFERNRKGYYTDDIRVLLTVEQRKALSRAVSHANKHRMIKHNAYRELCRRFGRIALQVSQPAITSRIIKRVPQIGSRSFWVVKEVGQ
jgi:hypothetical protein